MKKFLSMVVFVACVGSVAFASVRKPAASVQPDHAVVDTVPGDTSHAPTLDTTNHGMQNNQGTNADTSGVH